MYEIERKRKKLIKQDKIRKQKGKLQLYREDKARKRVMYEYKQKFGKMMDSAKDSIQTEEDSDYEKQDDAFDQM